MVAEPPKAIVKRRVGRVFKIRTGRGFSHAELKDVGISIGEARRLRLKVDERRSSKHEENIERLNRWLKEVQNIKHAPSSR